MERKLGISIYPEKSTVKQDKEYIDLAARYGYKRIFTCLLSADKPIDEIKRDFTEIINHGRDKGFEVILDVAPNIFDRLGISYDDLGFFADLGAHGVRLDLGFDGVKEAEFTHNPYNLKIELNLSNDVDYLNNIMTYKPNVSNLIGCHNFYPQNYTALSYEFFLDCTRRFKKHNLRTAAFVTCKGELGPWDINDGLCTLEMHRNLPITTQAKHLWATGLIDDVIIGDGYASEEQIRSLAQLNPHMIQLDVKLENDINEIEKGIAVDTRHYRRGDLTEYMVRSTEIRKQHNNSDISPRKEFVQRKGDVVVGNNDFGKYKGELQLILKEMEADTRKNLVGKIVKHERFLVDFVGAWDKFTLKEV